MTATLAIEFDWARDPKGYRLIDADRPTTHRVVRKGNGQKNLELCRPLDLTDSLFRIFSHVNTAEKLLDFVELYGPLTHAGNDEVHGDYVNLALSNADHMRQILRTWSPEQPDSASLKLANSFPLVRIDASLAWDRRMKSVKWELRPDTLLDALWLQLGRAVTLGVHLRQCQHCGEWFEAGRGSGRRADAKFCSEAHKIAYHSLKRSREK